MTHSMEITGFLSRFMALPIVIGLVGTLLPAFLFPPLVRICTCLFIPLAVNRVFPGEFYAGLKNDLNHGHWCARIATLASAVLY